MKSKQGIGIFDSGVGGLTVVKRVSEKLPQESIVYLADEAHVPYGERSPDEILSYALGITRFHIAQDVKLVIMACNMSSALALDASHQVFPGTPVIGVIEAGVRAAIKSTTDGRIGVLATTGTTNTRCYTRTIHRLLPEALVVERACPRFVPLVEAGMYNSEEAESAAREYLRPIVSAGCRTIILGCTHYPFLADTIRRAAETEITLIDPAEETAIEAANILFDTGQLDPPHAEPVHTYYTSARAKEFAEVGSKFLGWEILDVREVAWGSQLGAIEWQEKTAGQTTKSAL